MLEPKAHKIKSFFNDLLKNQFPLLFIVQYFFLLSMLMRLKKEIYM